MKNLIFISFISLACVFIESQAEANVLGRTECLLSEKFESSDWTAKNYRNDVRSTGFWHTSQRSGPDSLLPVSTSPLGKVGNGLEVRTNQRDNVILGQPYPQRDLLTPIFSEKWNANITADRQPVFLLKIFVPVLDRASGSFGFRQNAHDKRDGGAYNPAIWIKYGGGSANFYFRARNGYLEDIRGPAVTPGWWTLAIAYDGKGAAHYYVVQGESMSSNPKEIGNTFDFSSSNNPLMKDVIDGLFSLTYGEKTDDLSPAFIIDDFEVWAAR